MCSAAGWLPLCRVDQLARSGDRIALTLLGRPLLAVRDGDVIRVFGNVCAHRGSTIVEDGPSAGSTVRLSVSPMGLPARRIADRRSARRRVSISTACACLPCATTRGKGSCSSTSPARLPTPHDAFAGLSAAIEPWRWSEMVTVATKRFESTWNWKIMVENWIECYHHIGAHRDSVEPFQPARTTRVRAEWRRSLDGDDGRLARRRRGARRGVDARYRRVARDDAVGLGCVSHSCSAAALPGTASGCRSSRSTSTDTT